MVSTKHYCTKAKQTSNLLDMVLWGIRLICFSSIVPFPLVIDLVMDLMKVHRWGSISDTKLAIFIA